MGRVLTMVERRVAASERAEYIASLAARTRKARDHQAHFWVFEQENEPGRFVEFTESGREADIVAAHDGDVSAPIWREVQGD